MKLKEIHRTSTFAWSPSAALPLLATGTVAGALDESFSDESQLEIWAPDFLNKEEFGLGGVEEARPRGSIVDTARFNRLAWGYTNSSRPRGVIAAGMESGEIALWDPAKILEGAGASEANLLRNTTHTGPVRGLDFNTIQQNLLSSGGVSGEVYVWDLKDPTKPYTPTTGSRNTKLDEITSVAWNMQVPYVLAGASSTGYTIVWDLRGKREVCTLAYGGGAGTLAGQTGVGSAQAVGGRRGMSAIAWHPDNATRLVTASEDDSSPVIMVWDLKNSRAPEKILTGHEKGVLSLSWCRQDADLLLSCGKDNRALCWNPQTSEIIGELPSADNWAFQVEWCPRNPDLLATAFFDGTVSIHSIQSTNDATATEGTSAVHAAASGADLFDVSSQPSRITGGTLSLKQPPKWLRRPTSSSFGLGGKLVTISNLPGASGKTQSSVVHLRKVVSESDIVVRAKALREAVDGGSLNQFAEARGEQEEDVTAKARWKALCSLFKADSRDELVTLLGFSKEEVAALVAEAVENLKVSATSQAQKSSGSEDEASERTNEPVVSFAEPEVESSAEESEEAEKTPSELSGEVSDTTSAVRQDGESTTTAPSLFGDDNALGGAQTDFFNSISFSAPGASEDVLVPHTNYAVDSSVAATIGSRPSSAASETLKNNGFRIYPADESSTDKLVTKALVLGDFESAVQLCLSSDRFADAILLAGRGSPELLQRTQKAYFVKRVRNAPYLRLFESIVSNDLADVVQNADLQEWQEIFVVLCTFASAEEFANLAEQLGSRLEFQSTVAGSNGQGGEAGELRKHAILTYLAAGKLERLVGIWLDELAEEEKRVIADERHASESQYTAHAHALQTFIEKVTVFRAAIKYSDASLAQTASSDDAVVKTYKLSGLYDKYLEYAELLAAQGLAEEAVTFLKLTPQDYKGANNVDFGVGRERLLVAAGEVAAPQITSKAAAPAVASVTVNRAPGASTTYPYGGQQAMKQQGPYDAYAPPAPSLPVSTTNQPAQYPGTTPAYNGGYGATTHQVQYGTYAPSVPSANVSGATQSSQYPGTALAYNAGYGAQQSLTIPPHMQAARYGGPSTPSQQPPPPPPPSKKKDVGGWNDAPPAPALTRSPSAMGSKRIAITSPFPNSSPSTSGPPSPYTTSGPLPPPPRPGSVSGNLPPPPLNQRISGPPPPGQYARPPGGPSAPPTTSGPPPRLTSPPQQMVPPPPPQAGLRPPQTGQFASPSQPPPVGRTPPPPGPYGPPPGQTVIGAPAGQPGSYGPGVPQQAQPGPYNSPPMQRQPGPYAAPPQQGSFAPAQQGSYASAQQQPGPYGPGPQGVAPQSGPYAPPSGQYAPPPGQQPGPYGPGPQGQRPGGPQGQAPLAPPPGSGGPPPTGPTPARHSKVPPPKYPNGDRSHIPESSRPAFIVLSQHLDRLKQISPPQQKRLVEDLERRINPLFDALNCETLSQPVIDQLLVLTRAIENNDKQAALGIHVDLLTRGSQTDDIGLWMSGVKQLIMRM